MRTPFPNAFTIHKLGLPGKPFPLSIAVTPRPDGVTLLDLFPQRLIDVADLLERHAQETLLVFDVDHGSMERLEAVARQRGVPHVAYRSNAIAIPRGSLGSLARELGHWEFHLLDLPGPPTAEQIDRSRVTHPPNRLPDVDPPDPAFPLSQTALYSHDDCFLRIHSTRDALLRDVVARTLEICAGTILGPAPGEIGEFPSDVLERLWSVPLALTFPPEAAFAEEGRVVLGFSRTECSLTEKRASPLAGRVIYRPSDRIWSLEGR